MLGAVVTKDMEPGSVYGGVPAVKLNLSYFEPVTQQKKFAMMGEWADEFCVYWNGPRYFNLWAGVIQIGDSRLGNEKIYVAATHDFQCPDSTVFYLDTKTYTKHLGKLERDFIAFLLTNKARFIPEGN